MDRRTGGRPRGVHPRGRLVRSWTEEALTPFPPPPPRGRRGRHFNPHIGVG